MEKNSPCVHEDAPGGNNHYTHGIEPIVYIESHNMSFNEGNVVKYITRYKYKSNPLEDLKKTKYYIERLIDVELNKCSIG
tara:strand:- start:18 stop:257 length:240 start_codon:yes stop_codon:yes gene_type:complete